MRTGDKLAVKVIKRTKLRRDKELQKLVQREIDALTVLRGHPHVCQLVSVRDSHRGKCLAMEFLPGGTLFGLVRKKGKLTEAGARAAFRGISSAIRFCHRRGIVHRDIKAENVLLAKAMEPSTAKLCDFGLAARDLDAAGAVQLHRKQHKHRASALTPGGRTPPPGVLYQKSSTRAAGGSSPAPPAPRRLTLKAGTAMYSAPEVLAADGSYDGRAADVFSLGVLLFVCLTGHFPFVAPNDQALRRTMLAKLPDYRRYRAAGCLPVDAEELLRGMLCADPADRMVIDAVCRHKWTGLGLDSDAAFLADGGREHSIRRSRGAVPSPDEGISPVGAGAGFYPATPVDRESDFRITSRTTNATALFRASGLVKGLGSDSDSKRARTGIPQSPSQARIVPSPVLAAGSNEALHESS